jgi:hypothetical protein
VSLCVGQSLIALSISRYEKELNFKGWSLASPKKDEKEVSVFIL